MNPPVPDETTHFFLRGQPLFRNVSDEALTFLGEGCEQVHAPRGDILCHKGEPAPGLFCVLSGKVKLAVLSAEGNERVLDIVQVGGMFGAALMFLDQPCPLMAQALEDSHLMRIGRERIEKALVRFPDLALALLGGMAMRLQALIRDVEACCLESARQRVRNYLLAMAVPLDYNRGRLDLPASKAVVASSLNLTPETFSRELHRLVDASVIRVERRRIWIDDLGALESSV